MDTAESPLEISTEAVGHNPTLSPTAVPSKQPIIASSLVPAIVIPAPKINAAAIAGMRIDI
ncbi:MAG: hypothetical protein O7C72_07035 [Deltaproteobacteria bacterium]|nr:hypothetical protein [Deltaproteobacteria bacterium]